MAIKKATKPKAKAKPKKKTSPSAISAPTLKAGDYQSVDTSKADNGWIVRAYGGNGKSKSFVAKTKEEMQLIVKKLHGIK